MISDRATAYIPLELAWNYWFIVPRYLEFESVFFQQLSKFGKRRCLWILHYIYAASLDSKVFCPFCSMVCTTKRFGTPSSSCSKFSQVYHSSTRIIAATAQTKDEK